MNISETQWASIHYKLSKEYDPSVLIIRSKMRRVLGFTPRRHTDWIDSHPVSWIVLDWFDNSKKTFFLLKYSEDLKK